MSFKDSYLSIIESYGIDVKVQYGTYWIGKKGSLDLIYQAYDRLKNQYPNIIGIARDVHIHGAKNYALYETPNDVPIKDDHHFNEMFFDRPHRFYVDIEKKNCTDKPIDILIQSLKIIGKIYHQTDEYDRCMDITKVSIWECCRQTETNGYKVSFHVSLPFYLKNLKQIKEFGLKVHNEAQKYEILKGDVIDPQIYDAKHLLRLPNQSKLSEPNSPMRRYLSEYYPSLCYFNNIIDGLPQLYIHVIDEVKEVKIKKSLNMNLISSPKWEALTEHELVLSIIPNHEEGQSYQTWLTIGQVWKNEGFDISQWISWSNQTSKYTDQTQDCLKYWSGKLNNTKLRFGTVVAMAKVYQPKYQQIYKSMSISEDLLIDGGEAGHAEIFMTQHKDNYIVTNPSSGIIYTYDNETRLWVEKGKEKVRLDIRKYLSLLIKNKQIEWRKKLDEGNIELQNIARFKLENLSKASNSLKCFSYLDHIHKLCCGMNINEEFITKLNNIPYLLPTLNGTVVDLRDGTVRDRTKDDYASFEIPIQYLGKNADTPNATKFFNQIMNNDKSAAKYLIKCLGYCITGETSERALFLFWGQGHNGKSTVLELMNLILKDYYTAVSKDVFIKKDVKSRSSATPELMDLINKRIGVYSESDENERLNEGMIKQITGNDTISARPLYGKQITFKPYIKLVMLSNHRPQFNVDDEAIWNRLKYIPYLARFTSSPVKDEFKKDVEFIDNLKTIYLNEFFTVVVNGAVSWYNDKQLVEPESIKRATNEYMAELDSTAKFINDRCDKEIEYRIEPKYLYDAYCEFTSEEGSNRLHKPVFFKKIESQGYQKIKIGGIYFFKGLKLGSQTAHHNILAD